MLSSFLHTMLKPSKTTSPNKLFDYDLVTLYVTYSIFFSLNEIIQNINLYQDLPIFDRKNCQSRVSQKHIYIYIYKYIYINI